MDEEFVQEAEEARLELALRAGGKKGKKKRWRQVFAGAVAAAAAVFILLPNMSMSVAHAWEKLPVLSTLVKVVVWRDYEVQEGRYEANISVPQVKIELGEEADAQTKEQLKQSAADINASVAELTDRIIAEFESALADDADMQGADQVHVGHAVVTDSEAYFSLRVWNLEVLGSGYEQNYYYTIDRKTGRLLALSDLFTDSGYVQTISAEIKRQMRAQMAADENKKYWLDDAELKVWEFEQISDDQSFYITDRGTLVICFNEGDVAPMYMGCVTFEMPETIWHAQD